MKQIIFLFLFLTSLNATAQEIEADKPTIDLSRLKIVTDTTFTIADTTYWQFTTTVVNTTKPYTFHIADLVTWRGGQRTLNMTSGVMIRRDYLPYLRDQRDRLNREINTLRAAIDELQIQRAAIIQELVDQR